MRRGWLSEICFTDHMCLRWTWGSFMGYFTKRSQVLT